MCILSSLGAKGIGYVFHDSFVVGMQHARRRFPKLHEGNRRDGVLSCLFGA